MKPFDFEKAVDDVTIELEQKVALQKSQDCVEVIDGNNIPDQRGLKKRTESLERKLMAAADGGDSE